MVRNDSFRPREILLSLWRRWVEIFTESRRPGGDPEQRWLDARNRRRNSVMDAERLECLLLPTFSIDSFSVDRVSRRAPDLAEVLRGLEDTAANGASQARTLPPAAAQAIVDELEDYALRWRKPDSGSDGEVEFDFSAGPDYLDGDPDLANSVWLVDSLTMGLSVCLQGMYLIDRWLEDQTVPAAIGIDAIRLQKVRTLLSDRLTAALEGLCLSFTVSARVAPPEGGKPKPLTRGRYLKNTDRPWPQDDPRLRDVRNRIIWALKKYQTSTHEDTVDPQRDSVIEDLGGVDDYAFELGWSWGPLAQPLFMPEVSEGLDEAGVSRLQSVARLTSAEPYPYIYFTTLALEGVADLFSQRVRGSNLFSGRQSQLVSLLGFMAEVTSSYWQSLSEARGEDGRRAIEDIPWRTTDGSPNDYWSLYVISAASASEESRRNLADIESWSEFVGLLEELGQRARVTRRPVSYSFVESSVIDPADAEASNERLDSESQYHLEPIEHDKAKDRRLRVVEDPGLRLHRPGARITLGFDRTASKRKPLSIVTYDFAPRLLKLAAIADSLAPDDIALLRSRQLLQSIWSPHLKGRRVGLADDSFAWDDPSTVGRWSSQSASTDRISSWYITERMVEALVAAASSEESRSDSSGELKSLSRTLAAALGASLGRTHIDRGGELLREEERLEEVVRTIDRDPAMSIADLLSIAQALAAQQTQGRSRSELMRDLGDRGSEG